MNAKTFAAALIANALLSTALLIGYALWVAPHQAPRLAVLDVGELYRLKESQVTAVLMNRHATDEERSSALNAAASFGNQVTSLLQALNDDCRCLVLARGAVIGQPQALPDLTPDVRRRLGL